MRRSRATDGIASGGNASLGRSFLLELSVLADSPNPETRRNVFRQGMVTLAAVAERDPAPLEGLAADQLTRAVRVALNEGLFEDIDWLSAAAGSAAIYELAQALPPGAERRELGRRLLGRFRYADQATFVRLATAFARTAPRTLLADTHSARAAHVFAYPSQGIGDFALGVLAQPVLARAWVTEAAQDSLAGRSSAARLLAHAARNAVARSRGGDDGGIALFRRSHVRTALSQLLQDREANVWRHAAVARGLLAHHDSDYADAIDSELAATGANSPLRRGTVSAVAAFELGGTALAWRERVKALAREPGVLRSVLFGVAGYALLAPQQADEFVLDMISDTSDPRREFDGHEGVAEFCREHHRSLLPLTVARTVQRLQQQLAQSQADATQHGHISAMLIDLTADNPTVQQAVLPSIDAAREALAAGNIAAAQRAAKNAVDELISAVEELAQLATSAEDLANQLWLLREIDREVLCGTTLTAALTAGSDDLGAIALLQSTLRALENTLIRRERGGQSLPTDLRLVQLRALIRLLDTTAPKDADAASVSALAALTSYASSDHTQMRRAVWVAMTRSADALMRAQQIEVTDVLLVWTRVFNHDEDFVIVREASMLPEVESVFAAYVALGNAVWPASDPRNRGALAALSDAISLLAQALPIGSSPRVDGVRIGLAQLAAASRMLTRARVRQQVDAATLELLAEVCGNLALRTIGADLRLQRIAAPPAAAQIAPALLGLSHLWRTRGDQGNGHDELQREREELAALSGDQLAEVLPPHLAKAVACLLTHVVQLPVNHEAAAPHDEPRHEQAQVLPPWVPLSRRIGTFTVVRSIGRGAGGSVLLATRGEPTKQALANAVALKVADYDGAAARSMSEQEFEAIFRDEASALLTLPQNSNLARFITFDASAKPKPVLVMEYVRGPNLEQALDAGGLTMTRALAIVDGMLAGLVAMHTAGLAHLDVKPPNVVLRDGQDVPVLVDFGLAGRRLRPGCGSPHYAAREVWLEADPEAPPIPPFAADVYALSCIAAEMLIGEVLVNGETLADVVAIHLAGGGAARIVPTLQRQGHVELAQLLAAGLDRDWSKRPTADRMRRALSALTPTLSRLRWPLVSLAPESKR